MSCHANHAPIPFQTLVDNSMKVCDVVRTIASRFLIPDSERYSIQCLYGTQYVWLDSDQTLSSQGLGYIDHVIFRPKFILTDLTSISSSPYSLHLLYLECKHSVLNGLHALTLPQSLTFAALQMQITYKNYDPLVHVAGFIR